MTKNDFLGKLKAELIKKNVPDAAEITSEYAAHFEFKQADGYTEEEIAARLGNPVQLAAQFDSGEGRKTGGGKRVPVCIGLCFVDLFVGIFFVLLAAWGLVLAACAIACGAICVCLLTGVNCYALIPVMPYWCGAVFALAMAALAVLSAVGCVYFMAFITQLLRSFVRFQQNTLAAASGTAALPSLPIYPQWKPRVKRRLRAIALIALAVFAACFVLGMVLSMLCAGAIQFWHAWGWFGYAAA